MKELWKKVRNRYFTFINSELGGDPLINKNQLKSFKETLRKVMKVQQFDQLRKDVLPFIKELRAQSDRKFDQGMFSKKYWSNFLKKEENQDIKDLWESLPLDNEETISIRSMKKGKGFSRANKGKGKESLKRRKDLTEELSVLSEEDEENNFSEERRDSVNTAEICHFMDEFHDNDWQVPLQKHMLAMEEIFSEEFMSSPDKTVCTSEGSENDFLKSFWNEWNGRSFCANDLCLTRDTSAFLN